MRYPKYRPTAVPTPDGNKILVFQSFIDIRYPEFAIELYDPVTEIWTEFPGFPVRPLPDDYFGPTIQPPLRIRTCTFVSDSVFCIETELGVLALDIGTKLWEFSSFKFDSWAIGNYFPPIGNTRYSLLPGVVHDRVKRLHYRLPLTENERKRPYFEGITDPEHSLAVVHGNDGDDEVYRICTIEADVGLPHYDPGFNPCILIDVCRADLNNMDITLIKSFKFKLKLYRSMLLSNDLIPI